MTTKRRGFLLMEMIAAGVLLLAFTTVCVKYFSVLATQRESLNQRQAAISETSNIMERLMADKFDDLTPEAIAKITLSPEAKTALPDGELKIDLADVDAKPLSKRITVSIRWQDRNGQWMQPTRLVAWRYKQ